MVEHIGKIIISEELFLKWLDFYPEGKLRRISVGDYGEIEVHIEHPDMPEINPGDAIEVISPVYIRTTDALGHFVTFRERKS